MKLYRLRLQKWRESNCIQFYKSKPTLYSDTFSDEEHSELEDDDNDNNPQPKKCKPVKLDREKNDKNPVSSAKQATSEISNVNQDRNTTNPVQPATTKVLMHG